MQFQRESIFVFCHSREGGNPESKDMDSGSSPESQIKDRTIEKVF
jgi:hypothetical protein